MDELIDCERVREAIRDGKAGDIFIACKDHGLDCPSMSTAPITEDALKKENERLRGALENISQSLRLSWFTKEQARKIAKEALSPRKKD